MAELARTPVDLRSHFDERGDLDAWQFILIAATHTERHRRQIEALLWPRCTVAEAGCGRPARA
jgi:hypothetical protein